MEYFIPSKLLLRIRGMVILWAVSLVAVLVYTVFGTVVSNELQLNPEATLFAEVNSVHHNQSARHVTITLAANRRCQQPTFMVRLSGTALYLLDKQKHNHTRADIVVFGYPRLLDVGTYFLEILTMYCETLNPNQFQAMCLIHPLDGKNILTLPYSFEEKVEASGIRRPRWVLQRNETPVLLPTRYQKMCGATFCVSEESEIAQHNKYEWTDKPPYEHLVKSMLRWGQTNLTTPITGNETLTVCLVGASHAGQMVFHAWRMNFTHVNFVWVQNRYPQLFDVALLVNCTYAVMGYGQWPLSSWMGNQVYNAERYELEMRSVMESIKKANIPTQMFTRSMNLNGLGYTHTNCPAMDYRHPPLVMMYNSIMARLSAEYSIPYIDMFHLQGPLWDTALDWSHPMGHVFNAQVEFILHYVLQYSHTHRRKPALELQPSLRPEVNYDFRVRFTDSDTVYLLTNGKFRAIPDQITMIHLGYNDGQVTVVDASQKPLDLIGPPLPLI